MKKKLSFKAKLALIIAPFIIIIGVSIFSTNSLLKSLSEISEMSKKNIEGLMMQTLEKNGREIESSFNFLSYSGKDAILKRLVNEENPAEGFSSALEVFNGQITNLTGQLTSLNKNEDAKKIKEGYASIQAELQKWGESLNRKQIDGEKANIEFKSIRKKLKDFVKDNTQYKAENDTSAVMIHQFLESAQTKFRILNLIFVLVSVAVLIFSFKVSSQMSGLLNSIIENLKIQFNKLTELSKQLNSQSGELSSATQEQVSSIQETVSMMEEMTAMVRSNTQVAESTKNAALENAGMVHRGVNVIEEMVDSINQVKNVSEELPAQVETSGEELKKIINVINEINSKTKVINDIVFQTKLLSFNASVEAARAGEHGKGFAVVAEEVGSLAQMSAEASHEITALLDSSTKIVNETLENNKKIFMQSASGISYRVNESYSKASNCTEILKVIESRASTIGDYMGEIAIASKEQTQGIEGVNKALVQLDQVSHQNSLIANEAANMGSALQKNARGVEEILNELVIFIEGKAIETSKDL